MTTSTFPTPDQAMEMYRPLVEGNEQALPVLLLAYPDGNHVLGLEIPKPLGAADVLALVEADFVAEHGRPQWAVFSSETWIQTRHADDALTLQHGDIARLQAAGDPTVEEAVVVWAVNRRDYWLAARRFTRTDGTVTWAEHTSIGDEPDSPVLDVLVSIVRGT